MSENVVQEMVKKILSWLQGHAIFTAGENAVVAVSGGMDSMVLLDVMDRLRHFLGIRLHVAHLDHQLRAESAADSDFVAREAQARGLSCTCSCRNVAHHARQHRLSLEEGARQLRYQFLDEVALQMKAGKIILGHHANDQAETLLLRLVRGSGSRGLGAMAAVREDRYVRPLLACARETLEAYAQTVGLDYREDASNADLRFFRNRVRHELIPQLQRYNPNIVETLNRTARLLKEEDDYLNEVAHDALQTTVWQEDILGSGPQKIILDASRLLGYHIAVQRRIVRTLLQGLSASEGPFDFGHVTKVLDLVRRPGGGIEEIAAGLGVQRAGNWIILGRVVAASVEEEIAIPGELALPECGVGLRIELCPVSCYDALKSELGGKRAAFDARRLGARLRVRRPCPGDRFQPLGMQGRKKLSDFLVDLKWPRLLRGELLLLTGLDDEVVWVVGLRQADPFRVRPDTRQIALAELIRL